MTNKFYNGVVRALNNLIPSLPGCFVSDTHKSSGRFARLVNSALERAPCECEWRVVNPTGFEYSFFGSPGREFHSPLCAAGGSFLADERARSKLTSRWKFLGVYDFRREFQAGRLLNTSSDDGERSSETQNKHTTSMPISQHQTWNIAN